MYPEVMRALPVVMKEIRKLPRNYIANILYTIVGDKFNEWVQQKVQVRNAKVAEDRDMNVDLDPEIAEIFKNSTAVSGKYSFTDYCYS